MKPLAILVIWIALTIALPGVLIPKLVSADSDLAVLAGLLLIPAFIYLTGRIGIAFWRTIAREKPNTP